MDKIQALFNGIQVRREKINERLRCLQDIVPGCYKTMGLAVMLDEIINYVQSLQNQVEVSEEESERNHYVSIYRLVINK